MVKDTSGTYVANLFGTVLYTLFFLGFKKLNEDVFRCFFFFCHFGVCDLKERGHVESVKCPSLPN